MTLETLLSQQLNAHSLMVVALAFAGGIVSSMLPCTVGMMPVLIGYVGAYSQASKWSVLCQAFYFTLGIALVMTVLGLLAASLGIAFGGLVGSGWYYAVGAIAILMGLQLLGVIHLPLPQFVTKMPESRTGKVIAPLLMGMAFGAASSPCGTPFLTAILGFISREQNLLLGGLSLFAYALGQSVLLLVAGLFTGLLKHMATIRRVGQVIHWLSAAIFILAGLLLIAQAAGWLDVFAFY